MHGITPKNLFRRRTRNKFNKNVPVIYIIKLYLLHADTIIHKTDININEVLDLFKETDINIIGMIKVSGR